ncbi:MAG: type VI secretion system contractile sheath large subunit [Myxococcota bacterium]
MSDSRPFEIVVLADFVPAERGRALACAIDLDTLDSFLGTFRPRLELGLDFCDELELSSAAQLHPDALCALVHGLSALLEARAEAHDPARIAELVAEAGARIEPDAAASAPARPRGDRPPVSDRALLDELLGGAPRADTDPVRRLARSLGAAAGRAEHAAIDRRRAALDAELGRRLRALLGDPELRRLEALCLGLRALARCAPDPERLRIRAVHAPLDGLERAAAQIAGASFLIAAHGFGADAAGLARLRALALLAQGAGVSALACADPGALAAGGFQGSAWEKLRGDAVAGRIGLCHPRVLARLPYGARTDAIDALAFEELAREADASSFVWCDGALAAGRALARCVTETGDARALARFLILPDLPVYAGAEAEGLQAQGPTEVTLSEREAERLVARGLSPIVAMRGSDQARMPALLSISGRSLVGA